VGDAMIKDFREWMKLKTSLQNAEKRPRGYVQGEVWWTSVGENLGYEEDGKGNKYSRPVLIVRGFSKELLWAVPLSTTKNRGKYYHVFVVNGRTNVALLSQLRTLDTLRLRTKYGSASSRDFAIIKSKLRDFLS